MDIMLPSLTRGKLYSLSCWHFLVILSVYLLSARILFHPHLFDCFSLPGTIYWYQLSSLYLNISSSLYFLTQSIIRNVSSFVLVYTLLQNSSISVAFQFFNNFILLLNIHSVHYGVFKLVAITLPFPHIPQFWLPLNHDN